MKAGKVNLIVDGTHGSSGKGKIATYLADRDRPEILLSTNMPNAGHTAVLPNVKFISKILPTPAILNSDTYRPIVVLGASSSFFLERLFQEIEECKLLKSQVIIHPRAGIVTAEHAERERGTLDGPKSIASTMQGCGTFLSDKILRRPGLKLAKDFPELAGMVAQEYLPFLLREHMRVQGKTLFGEVSQGIGLDIHHGSHYPNCTSRSCTPMQFLTDLGLTHRDVGDVYLNLRTYPIRVGNIVEDGKTLGYSGDFYADAQEVTWEEVGKRSGMPAEETAKLFTNEKTTVTKRLRRVFEFSDEGLRRSVAVSGANKISLNFVQYIDWKADKIRGSNIMDLPQKVRDFVVRIERVSGLPVTLIGTGADNADIIDLEKK